MTPNSIGIFLRYFFLLLFFASCADVEDSRPEVFYRFFLSRDLLATERDLRKQDLIIFQQKLTDEQRLRNSELGAFVFRSNKILSIVSAQPYVRLKKWKLPVMLGSTSVGTIDQLKYLLTEDREISVFLVSIKDSVDPEDYLQYSDILGRLFMSLDGAGVMAISCKDDNLREVLGRRLKNWVLVDTEIKETSLFYSNNLRWKHDLKTRADGIELKSKIFQKHVIKDGSKK
jgi:hypothetical protein